jgi:hypothetical protein
MQGGKINFRFVLTVSILVVCGLIAVGLILVGYAIATQHTIGNFEPFGHATNVVHSPKGF